MEFIEGKIYDLAIDDQIMKGVCTFRIARFLNHEGIYSFKILKTNKSCACSYSNNQKNIRRIKLSKFNKELCLR